MRAALIRTARLSVRTGHSPGKEREKPGRVPTEGNCGSRLCRGKHTTSCGADSVQWIIAFPPLPMVFTMRPLHSSGAARSLGRLSYVEAPFLLVKACWSGRISAMLHL